MKVNLLSIIAMIILIIATSATTVSIMTFKPATPSSTIVFTEYQYIGDREKTSNAVKGFITKYSKFGYITKSITFGGYETRTVIVVMEKY